MPVVHVIEAADEAATRRLGAALAAGLQAGDVVALIGPLGTGKTRLVQGVAAALGCENQLVNSPTFVLIHEYDGRVPLYHVDAYRLRDSDEFLEIGGDEVLSGERACLIEWADRVADLLPRDHLRIDGTVVGEHERRWTLTAMGARSQSLLEGVVAALDKMR